MAGQSRLCRAECQFLRLDRFWQTFVNAGNLEWGGKMHDDLLDAVDWAIAAGIADPAHIAIFGASYGGYATLRQFAYRPTATPGVYHSVQPLLQRILLLVLNDLRDEPHNAFIKCFASQRAEKAAAFSK